MGNNMEFNPEIEEMKHQFQLLAEKVDKQKIVTDKLIKDVEKRKIRHFEFWDSGIFIILFFITAVGLVLEIYKEGYPIWTSFSLIYMSIILISLKLLTFKRHKSYLKSIGYDVVRYLEDLKKRQKKSLSNFIITLSLFIPVFVHLGYLLKYVISIENLTYSTQSYWIILITSIVLVCIMGILIDRLKEKITIRILE